MDNNQCLQNLSKEDLQCPICNQFFDIKEKHPEYNLLLLEDSNGHKKALYRNF